MRIVLIIILLILGFESWIYIQYFNCDYDIFIHEIILQYNAAFFIEKFPILFTIDKFKNLKIIFPCIITISIVCFGILFYLKNKIKQQINNYISYNISALKLSLKTIKSLSKNQKIIASIILLSIIFQKIILINRYPFSGDEAFSYFTFVENGIFLTTSFYPEPNNHILYNLICIVFNQFLNNPIYIMRIPNLVIYMLLIYVSITFLIKKFNFNTAIIFISIIGLSYSTSIYVVHGRGYELCSLLALLSFIFTIKYNEYKTKNSLVNLIIFNCLGVFTIPIFIYITFGITSFLIINAYFKKDVILLKNTIIFISFTVLGSAILYLPTIIISGLDAILNNPYLKPHTNLTYYYKHILPVASVEAIDFIIGTYSKGYIILSLIIIIITLNYKKVKSYFINNIVILFCCILFSTIITMLSKNVFGEPRVFTMIAYLFYFILSILIGKLTNNLTNKALQNCFLVSIFVSAAALTFTYDTKMDTFYGKNYLNSYAVLNKDIKLLTQNNHASSIYTDEKAHYLYLQLYNKLNNNKINIYNKNNSLPNKKYDYIVTDNDTSLYNDYKTVKSFSHKIILKRIQ